MNINNGSRKLPSPSPPGKIPSLKFPTQKIPTYNIRTHFINCLSSFNTASINGERVYMYIHLPGRKILISPGRFRVFPWNFGNINKIFIKNTFWALIVKYKASAHDQLRFLNTTQNLLTKFHMKNVGHFLLFNFLTWYKVITLHWECLITYEVDRWRLQLDHVTLSQNGFWSVHYILDT